MGKKLQLRTFPRNIDPICCLYRLFVGWQTKHIAPVRDSTYNSIKLGCIFVNFAARRWKKMIESRLQGIFTMIIFSFVFWARKVLHRVHISDRSRFSVWPTTRAQNCLAILPFDEFAGYWWRLLTNIATSGRERIGGSWYILLWDTPHSERGLHVYTVVKHWLWSRSARGCLLENFVAFFWEFLIMIFTYDFERGSSKRPCTITVRASRSKVLPELSVRR